VCVVSPAAAECPRLTYARTYTHMHAHTRMHMHAIAHIYACTHTHTQIHTHTHTGAQGLVPSSYVRVEEAPDSSSLEGYTHTFTHTRIHTHAYRSPRSGACKLCARRRGPRLVKFIRPHTHTHTHNYTHKYTHTHTGAQGLVPASYVRVEEAPDSSSLEGSVRSGRRGSVGKSAEQV